jgi:hypothetical protein
MTHRSLTKTLTKPLPLLAAGAVAAGLLGCSDSPFEDVRIRLCKDIAAVHAGAPVGVERVETKTPGYRDAQVVVVYRQGEQRRQAVCHYPYDAPDDTAQTLSQPLSAYASSPARVVIDGNPLPRAALAEVVKKAMMKQGRAFVDRIDPR